MLDGPLMLLVNWLVVDANHLHVKGNKFVMGMKIKATVDSKLNGSPVILYHYYLATRAGFSIECRHTKTKWPITKSKHNTVTQSKLNTVVDRERFCMIKVSCPRTKCKCILV